MDQEKIGKFIAICRKEQDLTQEQLAEKLNVSNKTVSRWENGNGFPDISLLQPLCEILNISVNELLLGEKIPEDNYRKKVEENVINILEESNRLLKSKAYRFLPEIKTDLSFPTILTIIFVVLKLTKTINWPWVWVVSPIWIFLLLAFIFLAIILIVNKNNIWGKRKWKFNEKMWEIKF